MAAQERSPEPSVEFKVPDKLTAEFIEETGSATFDSICGRIWELGITLDKPHFFRAYVEDNWTSVLAVNFPLNSGKGEAQTTGQRIIVNRRHFDAVGGSDSVETHDYVLDYHSGGIFHVASFVNLEKDIEGDDFTWNILSYSGPLLLPMGEELEVHYGALYQPRMLEGNNVRTDDLMSMAELMRTLYTVNESSREEIVKVSRYAHES